jgi:tetratricopeptide (TPR) repeat protein
LGRNEAWGKWDFAGAEGEFKRAFELDPNDATAHQWYAELIGCLGGREQEALAEATRAHQLDPLSPVIGIVVGYVHGEAGRHDEAIAACKKVASENPSFARAHDCLAGGYWHKRMYAQSIEENKVAAQLSGDRDEIEFASAMEQAFRSAGWRGAQTKAIEISQSQHNAGYGGALDIASSYADLGDKEQAFRWLNTAYQEHDLGLACMKTNHYFDSIRSDPRFAELVRKVGLPQ